MKYIKAHQLRRTDAFIALLAMTSKLSEVDRRAHHHLSLPGQSNISSGPNSSRHPPLKAVEATRPDWHEGSEFTLTKTKNPEWKYGEGASDGGESLKRNHVEIDPYEEGRPTAFNHKLLISGIVPRPIGFLSTRSEDGMRSERSSLMIFNVCCPISSNFLDLTK